MCMKVFIILIITNAICATENTMTIPFKTIEHNEKETTETHLNKTNANLPQKWITDMFQEAEQKFTMLGQNVSDPCKKDFKTYQMHLSNQSVWAIRMMESSEWPVKGILYGTGYHLGIWYECLLTEGPDITGQYCVVEATLQFKFNAKSHPKTSNWVENPLQNASAWSVLKMFEKQSARLSRQKQYWTLCTPSSCTTTDLKNSLSDALNPAFQHHNINVTVQADPRLCYTRYKNNFVKPHTYSFGFYFTWCFFICIIFTVAVSTVYDLMKSDDGKESNRPLMKLVKCFSMKANYHDLTHIPSTNYYPGIYTAKVASMCLIIYAHRMLYTLGSPLVDAEIVEVSYKPMNIELVFDGIVDAFLSISGFLTCLLGIKPMKKGGIIYMIASVVVRWLRMIPLFAIIIIFIIYVLPFLGDGPFWNSRILREVENCKENWWTNILGINNIVHPERMCLILSYYIAVDIQLSVIGAVLLLIIVKNKKIGLFFYALVLIISTALTFVTVYSRRYYGHLRFFMSGLQEPRNDKEFVGLYISTNPRVGPYLIGFMAAYIGLALKKRNDKITHKQVYAYTGLAILVGVVPQLYAFEFYKDREPYHPLKNALYASFHRMLYVLPFSVSGVLYVATDYIILNSLAKKEIFVPLGRLIYSTLLGSFILQLYDASSLRKPLATLSRYNIIWISSGDILLSFTVAFLMYLFLEGPINRIIKEIVSKLLESHKPKESSDNTEKDFG